MLKLSSTTARSFVALGALLWLTATGLAEQPPERNYQLSDDAADVLTKSKTSLDAKNYDQTIAEIDAQLAKTADHGSYDYAILTEFKAQALLLKGDYKNARISMEQGLQISDAHTPPYSEDHTTRDLCYFLAQMYYQEAAGNGQGAKMNVAFLEKAEGYMVRWIALIKKPTPEGLLFYASLLYTHATLDADHADPVLLKKTLEVVEQGLHLAAHPKDQFYVLKLAAFQQLGRDAEASELLELLVAIKPDNKTYWQQLAGLYLQSNQEVRAITAIERAQARGYMTSPKENYTLVGIHFNLQQYGVAADLLEKGLHNRSIESDEQKWLLLASAYQQLHRDVKAISVLEDATKFYPKSGQLEYLLAQNLYSLNNNEEALKHVQLCVDKGGGNKPAQAYLFLAYIAFELKKFDIALKATEHAMTMPEAADRAGRMKKAIDAAILDREEKKKQM